MSDFFMSFYFAGELTKSKSKISQHAEEVWNIMLAVKGSTVELGLLCLTTDLRPRAVTTCKWTEKASTTKCFVNLFDDLAVLTKHDDSKVNFTTSRQFKTKSLHSHSSGMLLPLFMACYRKMVLPAIRVKN
jgi:hypothetical protein